MSSRAKKKRQETSTEDESTAAEQGSNDNSCSTLVIYISIALFIVLLIALGLYFALKPSNSTNKKSTKTQISDPDSSKMAEDSQDSSDFTKEKNRYLAMSVKEKRKHYKCIKYMDIGKIEPFSSKGLGSKVSLIRKCDITCLEIDAVVNAANEELSDGGGVCGAIHAAAGRDPPLLQQEGFSLAPCSTGKCKITGGYKLPAKYVLHCVGPKGGNPQRESLLASAYTDGLEKLVANSLRTIAFPCISTKIYGYDPKEAADVAMGAVKKWLKNNKDKVDRIIFCTFADEDYNLYKKKIPTLFN